MNIDSCRVGPIQTNCYIIWDDTACIVVDPGYDVDAILTMLGGRVPDLIVVTHYHMDHIGALPQLVKATGAPVAAFEGEVPLIVDPPVEMMGFDYYGYVPVDHVDMPLADGQKVTVGDLEFEVLHTPGHTKGSWCAYFANQQQLFSGDTLFYRACGRTDFPGGDPDEMRASLQRLMRLPDEAKVYPGHDRSTTIGDERAWIARL